MGRNFFMYFLILLITISSSTYNLFVSSHATGAGTCNVAEMSTKGHGASSKSGTGGFSITTSKSTTSSSSYTFKLQGTSKIKGLLIYTVDSSGTRTGDFSIPSNFQEKSCGGEGSNTLTHTSSSQKSLPIELTWAPSGDEKSVIIKTIAVVSYSEWYQLNDVTIDLSSGTSNVTTPSADSGSSGSSGSSSGSGFFEKYTLFVILAIIIIILYISASTVEYMLRRQKVNIKKGTKNL